MGHFGECPRESDQAAKLRQLVQHVQSSSSAVQCQYRATACQFTSGQNNAGAAVGVAQLAQEGQAVVQRHVCRQAGQAGSGGRGGSFRQPAIGDEQAWACWFGRHGS